MYKYIFIDLDDTLFDFEKSEMIAFTKISSQFAIQVTHSILNEYKAYNKNLWKQIELGLLTKQQLVERRFPNFFDKYGVIIEDGPSVDQTFRDHLAQSTQLKNGAKELLQTLKKSKRSIFAATNGIDLTQRLRLSTTNISQYFDNIFTSEALGFDKPNPNFFYQAFKEIEGFDSSAAVMVGDKLSSDMKGAQNVGIDSCWFNERQEQNPNKIPITFESDSLEEICDYLLKV